MADLNNLLPGDEVLWILKNEIVNAKVLYKKKLMVCIEVQVKGMTESRFVNPKTLRLIYGGKKRLERDAAKVKLEQDMAKGLLIGPQRLRELSQGNPL